MQISLVEYLCLSFRSSRAQMLSKIGALKVMQYSRESTCVGVSFKQNLLKRDCPVNIAEFLRKAFFIEQIRWLLLAVTTIFRNYHWEDLLVILITLTHPSKRLREATVRRFFISEKVFLKIFANFSENTCVEVWSKACNFNKKRSQRSCFLLNIV